MLTIKEINEISFGKAGFSGYKPEDVDKFIDEVASSFQELTAQRDEAEQKTAQLTARLSELESQNSDMQKKLAVLAQKVESYRNEEDGIKDAILSAQRLAKDSVQEARDKAEVILADARDEAKGLLENAKLEASKLAKEYMAQADDKREELEEIKRQVTAFRSSLLEMYKKHLEDINRIPAFRVKESAPPVEEKPEEKEPEKPEDPHESGGSAEEAQTEEAYEEEEPAEDYEEEAGEYEEEPEEEEYEEEEYEEEEPYVEEPTRTLHDKVNFSAQGPISPKPLEDLPEEDDLTDVGIDVRTYSNIPESLRREKSSHFSNLEFGEGVDLGGKKRKK